MACIGLKRNLSRVLVGKERDCLKDLHVDGKVVFEMYLTKMCWGSMDWIQLDQDRKK